MGSIAKHAPHTAPTDPAVIGPSTHSVGLWAKYTGYALHSPDNVKLDKLNSREVRALVEVTVEIHGIANSDG